MSISGTEPELKGVVSPVMNAIAVSPSVAAFCKKSTNSLYLSFISKLCPFSTVGTRGLKSRMCPPYPHACRKRQLEWGAVV